MKIKDIRDMGIDELKKKNTELVEELLRLRIRHASEKIESTAMLSNLRKDIARIKTVLREKEAAS
ncbi:MAG TPA: 50S ribosomal protein L29 [Smithellaceae bacterium]|nr:50S ribosomal protein L29 [Smithellaceae bacterium]HRS89839.1 50S ribosomal protein L29 [Smithellaceae bacterium]HRV26650.1 50S ribosomal protein L29 [Smithellaceae bacterium]